MTDLSPAAQAVLDAANGRSSYGPDDCLSESRWIAAAALRAAADQLNYCLDGSAYSVVALGDLLVLAAELEAE